MEQCPKATAQRATTATGDFALPSEPGNERPAMQEVAYAEKELKLPEQAWGRLKIAMLRRLCRRRRRVIHCLLTPLRPPW